MTDDYIEIYNLHVSTPELFKDAKQVIRQKTVDISIPHPHQRGVQIDKFLQAMLDYAVEDAGKRYAACTILATRHGHRTLEQVASTWLHDFIFPSELYKS
jgi:hypothetical protein